MTSIGDSAFRSCSSLTTITIPETVKTIDSNAFYGCSSLQTVDFGTNSFLQTIKGFAFYYCTSLTTITIPETVTSIGSSAFSGCTNLQYNNDGEGKYLGSATNPYFALIDTQTTTFTSITINANCKIIADSAFRDCSSLQTVDFGTNSQLQSIGSSAFSGCTNLQYNNDGEGKYLGSATNPYFALIDTQTTTFTSITINANCKIIADSAFRDCSSLTTITIPESVNSIGSSAFSYCSRLTTVVIESQEIYESATDISPYACGNLLNRAETVKVPTSIVSAYDNSFLEGLSSTTEMIGNVEYTVFTI